MNVLGEALRMIGGALGALLTQPFYYIFLIGVLLHYRRQGILERKLFNIRIYVYAGRVLRTVITGIIVGLLVSIVMAFIGIHIQTEVIWCIGTILILLSVFRLRYAHITMALAVLTIIYMVLLSLPSWQPIGFIGQVIESIRNVDLPGLLAISVLLQLIEAVLFRMQATRFSSPVVIEGKRGKPVGAYAIEAFWSIPLWLFIPSTGGLVLPWTPLHGAESWINGVSLTALPVMIGCSILTQTHLPQVKVNAIAKRLLQSSFIMIVLAALALWWAPIAIPALVIAVILREWIMYVSRREESQQSPLFIRGLRGLKILDVIPASPAAELGITAGESVYKVNGQLIQDPQSLHAALRINPAFCKLEILNIQGESKFLQRAIYAGDHHQLGMIFAPDDQAVISPDIQRLSVWHLVTKPRVHKLNNGYQEADATLLLESNLATETEVPEEPIELTPEYIEKHGLPKRPRRK
ncbi:serine protease [Paenibacillus sp. PsM32]|nr:PDZ domain-containing protein [Paenibacillus sp. PsM32]MDN4620667.1 serine protease [Paenibacillus sp. PsM32]